MTNKFRRMQPVPIPEDLNAKPAIVDLTQGINLAIPPRKLPLGASPNLDHVRFEAGALRKDFGSTAVGTAAPSRILAIGEHKYLHLNESFHRLIRIRRSGSKLVLDVWDGTTWIETAVSDEDIPDSYIDVASTQNIFAMATGEDLLIWYESGNTARRYNDFPAANSLIAIGDTAVATVTPAGAINDEYQVYYSVDLTILSGTNYTVTVALLHNGLEIATKNFVLESGSDSWVHQVFELIRPIADGDTLTLQVKDVASTSPTEKSINLTDTGSAVRLEGEKTTSAEDINDDYIYRFYYENTGSLGDLEVRFYVDKGAGWVQVGTDTLLDGTTGTFEKTINIPDAGANTFFAVEITSGGASQFIQPPTDGRGIVWYAVGAGDFELSVHGYNWDTDSDGFAGVEYIITVPVESIIEKISPYAPGASFILPFGDRLLSYRDDGDHQVAAWSADGLLRTWYTDDPDVESFDAGETVLVDTRSDGIDNLMGAAVLTASTVAVFRKRSIMRAQETGQTALAMAHYHWIENLGTESPFSLQSTPHGILFLGHNLQVYLLTPNGPQPVGGPIHEQLIRDLTSNLELVDSGYDSVFGEYYLGVPENNATNITGVWILEFDRFVETQELKWRYRSMAIQRIGTVSVIE